MTHVVGHLSRLHHLYAWQRFYPALPAAAGAPEVFLRMWGNGQEKAKLASGAGVGAGVYSAVDFPPNCFLSC
jgi:hypothetical protein